MLVSPALPISLPACCCRLTVGHAAVLAALLPCCCCLQVKVAEYNTVKGQISAALRKAGGSLAVRDISGVVTPGSVVDSENLATLFVVVSKYSVKEWEACYEKLCDFVVRGCSCCLLYFEWWGRGCCVLQTCATSWCVAVAVIFVVERGLLSVAIWRVRRRSVFWLKGRSALQLKDRQVAGQRYSGAVGVADVLRSVALHAQGCGAWAACSRICGVLCLAQLQPLACLSCACEQFV